MTSFRSRDVHLLVGAAGLSALGDLALAIPLALQVREKTGSALAVSLFFLCMFGPIVLLAGVAGRLVDCVENRALVIGVSLAQAAATSMLLFAGSPAALLVLTAVIGSGLAVVAPAEFSLIPVAAGEDRVAAANGRVEAARYLGMTAGPVLGGLLASSGRFHAAVLLNAGSFLVVALAGLALRSRRRPVAAPAGERKRARDGLTALVADPALRIVLATGVASLALFSMSMTAELFFVLDVLHAGQTGYGVLIGVWTAGMVTGAALLGSRLPAARLAPLALAAIALQGAGLLGASLATAFGAALAGFALGGLAHGVKNVAIRTLIHKRVPEAVRGRAFAGYNAARNAAELGALGLGGVLVGLIGARATLALSGAIPLLLGLSALLLSSRSRGAAAADPTTTRRSLHAHVEG
jgi:Na+/melibiose symporter-like transporter